MTSSSERDVHSPTHRTADGIILRFSPDTQSGLQDYVDDILASDAFMVILVVLILVAVVLYIAGLATHTAVPHHSVSAESSCTILVR